MSNEIEVQQPQGEVARQLTKAEYQGSLIRGSFNAVCNADTVEQCGDLIKMLGKQISFIEERRKIIAAGILESKKELDTDYKELKRPFEEAKARVQDLIDGYAAEQRQEKLDRIERERKEADAVAMQEAGRLEDEGDTEGAEQVLEDAVEAPESGVTVLKAHGEVSATTFDVEKDYEVENIQQVPWEFLKVEIRRAPLLAAIKAGAKDIPGIKITETARGKVR